MLYSVKSTRALNEYSHFGKLSAIKGSKMFGAEFKHGMKNKDIKYNKQRTVPVDELALGGTAKTGPSGPGGSALPVSFEMQDNQSSQLAPPESQKIESKSTERNEDVSDDPSFKLVERLFDDE